MTKSLKFQTTTHSRRELPCKTQHGSKFVAARDPVIFANPWLKVDVHLEPTCFENSEEGMSRGDLPTLFVCKQSRMRRACATGQFAQRQTNPKAGGADQRGSTIWRGHNLMVSNRVPRFNSSPGQTLVSTSRHCLKSRATQGFVNWSHRCPHGVLWSLNVILGFPYAGTLMK